MNPKLLHDLRSPLARARSLAKMLEDASPREREEFVRLLLESLEELDNKLAELTQTPLN